MSNTSAFTFPNYYLDVIEFSIDFVDKHKNVNHRYVFKESDTFADLFTIFLMTQCKENPDDDKLYENLLEFYDSHMIEISTFILKFSEKTNYDFVKIYEIRNRIYKLEKFYKKNFGAFLGTFGNSAEFISFFKKFLGIKVILRHEEILYLLGAFTAEYSIPRHLAHALKVMKIMNHHYDTPSFKFFIHTISARVGLHPNFVVSILNLNVNEWMREARLLKIEDERQNEYTF